MTLLPTKTQRSCPLMPDYLHPSPEGYRVWAKAIGPKLKELLGEPSQGTLIREA